jgi:hypothetical protein
MLKAILIQILLISSCFAVDFNELNQELQKKIEEAYTCETTNDLETASALFFTLLAIHPDTIELQFGKPITSHPTPSIVLNVPFWNNEDLTDKTIVVYYQKGFGDTLLFCRYLTQLNAKKVIFFCQKPLKELVANSFENIDVISDSKELEQVQIDYQAPLLALPFLLDSNFSSIPLPHPYLKSELPVDEKWLTILPKEEEKKLHVGIVWTGDANHPHNKDRTIPLEQLKPLFDLENVVFYSLQIGQSAPEPMIDLTSHVKNFSDTAGFMKRLDVLIAVDTSSCHLGAGLIDGPKTFIPLPKRCDLKWAGQDTTSPFYSKATLFRQKTEGNWEDVVLELKEALNALSQEILK